MNAQEFLVDNIKRELKYFFSITPSEDYIQNIAACWMNDRENSKHRYTELEKRFSSIDKILDMGSGCGTFVFYGLINEYDVYGVDCEQWKFDFIKKKAAENGYPSAWSDRFTHGYGEALPFSDNSFQIVSTYQVLEHVDDVEKCVQEMIRVTKPGGAIHIQCPDYTSLFEGHYMLPWLPLLPRRIANSYLKMLKRPVSGLTTINYVTTSSIKKQLKKSAYYGTKEIEIINLDEERYKSKLKEKIGDFKPLLLLYPLYKVANYIRHAFTKELTTNLLVLVNSSIKQ